MKDAELCPDRVEVTNSVSEADGRRHSLAKIVKILDEVSKPESQS
jgi:hypothetical protein